MGKSSKIMAILMLLFYVIGSIGAQQSQLDIKPATYTWISGGMGGGWYTVAGGLARLINEKDPRITIKVIPGGGVSNPLALSNGDADIAQGVGWVDKAAYKGEAPLFKKSYTNMYAITGALTGGPYQFLAAKDQNITTFEELANKVKRGEKLKIVVPQNGTSEFVLINSIMDFHGISFDMIKKNGGVVNQAIYGDMPTLYKDRHVDYAFACLSLPGAIITEMAIARSSTLLSVSEACIDHFATINGTIPRTAKRSLWVIPAGMYPGISNEVESIAQSAEILVSPKLPDAVAYTMAKIINENKPFLITLTPGLQDFEPNLNALSAAVPLHPGALKYYKEVGVIK